MKKHFLLMLLVAAGAAGAGVSAQTFPTSPRSPLSSGDWVGQISVGDSALFVRARFTSASLGVSGSIDVPQRSNWDLALLAVRLNPPSLAFAFVLGGDTARFEGLWGQDGIRGSLLIGEKVGTLELIRRISYDSAKVRRFTGNYRLASDRVISMGPLDEVGGWLAFFDSKTRRGGILYALSDSVFFTGPTFGIDYPIAIRAEFRLDPRGRVRGLIWRERDGIVRGATRLDDHVSEDVSFQNGAVRLAGTVTAPKGTRRHPAVILIHGAGRTIPTRDFGYWSSYFAGHGVAVLAFDKRGGGGSTGDPNTATYEDLADDVLAGLAYLQTRSDIDPKRIGLYGTSNGGYIAPLAAVRSGGQVAFIAVRSGSARRVGDNIAYEVGNDLRSQGFSDAEAAEAVAIRQHVTDFVISHPRITPAAWDSLKGEVNAVAAKRWYPWSRVLWVPRVATNVLLQDPHAIYSFEDNEIVIPAAVLEEIDSKKRYMDEIGRNARYVSRLLDQYRQKGKLHLGVDLETGGTLRVELNHISFLKLQDTLIEKTNDNRIIAVALNLFEEQKASEYPKPVILVSKDALVRVKADVFGLQSEDFLSDQVVQYSKSYTGYQEILVEKSLIEHFYTQQKLEIKHLNKVNELFPHQFVILKDECGGSSSAIGKISVDAKLLQPLQTGDEHVWGVKARNAQQKMAFDILLNDDIPLVTMTGKAGTGKTLLSLAAGLLKIEDEHRYQKMLVARPVVPMGKDIGFLPGEKEEKLRPWMQPIFDNLEYLFHTKKPGDLERILAGMNKTIEVEALTYIRGRSIPDQYIIIDEAQNLTKHEVKTIITRVGEGSKIILMGDPEQIDHPYLDESNNGLTYVIEQFKSYTISAHVKLEKGERSPLAQLAAQIL